MKKVHRLVIHPESKRVVPEDRDTLRKSEGLDLQAYVIGWAWEDEALDADTGQRACEVVLK